MDKNIIAWVCIENALHMICWAAIAIHFGHWWMALFAVLFMSRVKWSREEKDDG